jgi:hypothetical protein
MMKILTLIFLGHIMLGAFEMPPQRALFEGVASAVVPAGMTDSKERARFILADLHKYREFVAQIIDSRLKVKWSPEFTFEVFDPEGLQFYCVGYSGKQTETIAIEVGHPDGTGLLNLSYKIFIRPIPKVPTVAGGVMGLSDVDKPKNPIFIFSVRGADGSWKCAPFFGGPLEVVELAPLRELFVYLKDSELRD